MSNKRKRTTVSPEPIQNESINNIILNQKKTLELKQGLFQKI